MILEESQTSDDPWAEISVGANSHEVRLRRADPLHPLDFFRGRNAAGQYLFVLQARGAVVATEALPAFAALNVYVGPRHPQGSELILTLTARSEVPVFRALCADLMAATSEFSPSSEQAIPAVLERLFHWQRMLRRLTEQGLDRAKILGLFGELLLMRDEIVDALGARAAVCSWRGPHGEEQDFLLDAWRIEVKTQLATSDRVIKVASPEQLDSLDENILLCHQTLDVVPESQGAGRTLNSLAAEVGSILRRADGRAYEFYIEALVAVGYSARPEYDAHRWSLDRRTWYRVRDGFPRLTSGMLPGGVEKLQYAIRLEACRDFRVEDSLVATWLRGGTNER